MKQRCLKKLVKKFPSLKEKSNTKKLATKDTPIKKKKKIQKKVKPQKIKKNKDRKMGEDEL